MRRVYSKIKKPIDREKFIEKICNILNVDFISAEKMFLEAVDHYEIIQTRNGRYVPIYKTSFRIGVFHDYQNNGGYVLVDGKRYSVMREDINNAIDRDTVLIDTLSNNSILKVLDRKVEPFLAVAQKINGNIYAIPDDDSMRKLQIIIKDQDIVSGTKVMVSLEKEIENNLYYGKVDKVLEFSSDKDVDILVEARRHGFDKSFSQDVLDQLKTIPDSVSDFDKIGRMDLTDWEVFTIDSFSAKDLDDAVSLKTLPNGNYLLGVHIADVTNYVKYGTPLYWSARERGTSGYFADQVFPMLPYELSNGICSLNPNVDRLTLSCIMEINLEGEILHHFLWQSVICSNLKMTYEDVNAYFDSGVVKSEYQNHISTLEKMKDLAEVLYCKRILNGAIDLDRPELKLRLNDQGGVVDFSKRIQKTAEKMIEEFMLIANETVALHMSEYPFIYRIHEEPTDSRVENYLHLLKQFRYPVQANWDTSNFATKVLSLIENSNYSELLKTQLLYTFRKARYSSHNIGHFGLASAFYCHFTSPIRRFPDTTVHQLIKDFEFSDQDKEELKKKWKKELTDIAKHSSDREKDALKCERMVLLMKCAEYMEHHVGEEFNGTVISMDSDGMYVELDNMIEGKIRFKDLSGKYLYHEETSSFLSLTGREDYYLGDYLKLKVNYANKENKIISFKPVCKIRENDRVSKKNHQYVKMKNLEQKREEMYYNINKGHKKD